MGCFVPSIRTSIHTYYPRVSLNLNSHRPQRGILVFGLQRHGGTETQRHKAHACRGSSPTSHETQSHTLNPPAISSVASAFETAPSSYI
ncbi:hypothetical protein XA68_17542 [Ophiocordyceps unilateralis]|uniref:Uncharacterized protein n=1 Tax=Ophiocordyceps unilateralis TaxID=268505 RepID=A0A2A9PJG7_OPHUN|nr:hypothetical protein XA68_17542 [Ophiocordyceps unilateralis]